MYPTPYTTLPDSGVHSALGSTRSVKAKRARKYSYLLFKAPCFSMIRVGEFLTAQVTNAFSHGDLDSRTVVGRRPNPRDLLI